MQGLAENAARRWLENRAENGPKRPRNRTLSWSFEGQFALAEREILPLRCERNPKGAPTVHDLLFLRRPKLLQRNGTIRPAIASQNPFLATSQEAANGVFWTGYERLAGRTETAYETGFDRLCAADVGRTGCHLFAKHRFSQATREPRSSSPILPRPHSVPCHSSRV